MKFSALSFKPLLVAWLCLVSAVDFKVLSGLVLCFGEDGHIELEGWVNDKCGKLPESTRSEGAAMNLGVEDHCGTCRDVSLFAGTNQALRNRAVVASFSGLNFFVPVSAFPPMFPRSAAEKPWPLPPSVAPSELALIRTVRLLV